MVEVVDWAKDLLLSRGALVETEGERALRAMLSPELAASLDASEWLSLRFGAGAGSDDEGDWVERLGRLLPRDARVVGARLRHPGLVRPIDCGAVLERELVIQNGIFRHGEEHQETARYYFFNFHYTVESDETSLGTWTACLNASAHSLVPQDEALMAEIRDGLEEDPAFTVPREELTRLYRVAVRGAQPEIRRRASSMEQSANRRLLRDTERIESYYRDLLRQIEKQIVRRGNDPAAAEIGRSRAAATQLDRRVKLEDVAKKYSLRVRVEPGDVLVVTLPVREISVRLIRKKAERMAKLHWNPALGKLESPWCEGCFGRAWPLFLCDERVHCVCKQCLSPCAGCGKHFCRACHAKCKCGEPATAPAQASC